MPSLSAAWLAVGVTLAVSSPVVWAQQSTTSDNPDQGESATTDRAQLDPADVTGRITIREGVDATSPAVDAGTTGNDAGDVVTGRPTVLAPRITERPRLDGRLDDVVWRTASRITEFVQQRPLDGAPASEQTDVFVAYDSANLYFGVHAHYSDSGLVRANRVDRDQTTLDDRIAFYLDPFLDQQQAFLFSVNGYGVQSDATVGARDQGAGGGRGRQGGGGGGGGAGGGSASLVAPTGDISWDALFSSAGTLVEDGWTAEIAIPFKSLRYPQQSDDEVHRWGFQVVRTIEGKDESDVWAPLSRDVAGFLSQMGLLEGMTGLSRSRNLEIMPTVTAGQAGFRDTTGQFVNANDAEGGVNVKYGITSNLTLDFTYNPDFSQIETDRPQVEVNQRFPINYPELRPFFLEGQELFSIRGPVTFVQTRAIVDPQYGAKLTGKVGRTALAFLVANDEAPGKVEDRDDPAFGQKAQVVIGRVRYDLYSESHLGVLVTDREFLDGHSRLGGVDGSLRLGPTHSFSFMAGRTSNRDVDGVERNSHAVEANIRKEGRNLGYFFGHYQIDPDFQTDTGFVRRVDLKTSSGNISYRWWPESWIVNWGPRVNHRRIYNFDGVLQDSQTGLNVEARFTRNIDVRVTANRDMERFSGIDFWKTRFAVGGNVRTSRRVSFGGEIDTGDQVLFEDNPYLGSGTDVQLNITLRPTSRLQSEVTLDTSRFLDIRGGVEEEIFDVRIWRAFTTYQFTSRLLLRNIMEYNTFDKRLLANILATYRVNAGTVFFAGYDARYDQGDRFDGQLFPNTRLLRTNHAIFMKLQYLFRL